MIAAAKGKPIELEKIIGISLVKIPYINHKNSPDVYTMYIKSETSLARLVLIIFIVCGRVAAVVRKPASIPKIVK